MKHPAKWRDTIDPFSLPLHTFRLFQVIGYPHAGNDVFYVDGVWLQKEVKAYLKVERQKGADIANEIEIIRQLQFPYVPQVLDYSLDKPCFVVTEEMPGERLSVILGNNECFLILNWSPPVKKINFKNEPTWTLQSPVNQHRRQGDEKGGRLRTDTESVSY